MGFDDEFEETGLSFHEMIPLIVELFIGLDFKTVQTGLKKILFGVSMGNFHHQKQLIVANVLNHVLFKEG